MEPLLMDSYVKNVSHPTKYLCVRSRTFNQNTTPKHIQKLLVKYGVVGTDGQPYMTKDEAKNQFYAIVKFKNASSASEAIERVEEENQNHGKETMITVSPFVHAEYTIGDAHSYKKFINDLRDLLARREDGSLEYIEQDDEQSSPNQGLDFEKTNPKILRELQRDKQPKRWIHIKLIAQESTTTLVIRDDNVFVKGFTGKDRQWFQICNKEEKVEVKLPEKYYYKAKEVWGIKYRDLMKLNDNDQVKATLESTKLGKDFAERAVRRLSGYKEAAEGVVDDIPVRLGLAGLIVMICESARFQPLLDHFGGDDLRGADCWNHGKGSLADVVPIWQNKSLSELIWNWKNMSVALHRWKEDDKDSWDTRCGAENCYVASCCVQLVQNTPVKTSQITPHVEADVEILQVLANLDVAGIKRIKVIDEAGTAQNNIQIVQHDQEHEDKKMALMVPKVISGYAWFDIELEASSCADDSIKMRWDCRKDDGVEYQVVTRDITLSGARDGGRNHRMQFTYLVMSNAVQADVVIKLRLPAGDEGGSSYTARGTIYAYISDIKTDNCPIVLFKSDPIAFTSSSSGWTLKLYRSASADDSTAVRVPQGKQLQIDIGNLQIKGPGDRELKIDMEKLYFEGPHVSSYEEIQNGRIRFDIKNSGAAKIPLGGGRALEVKVTWKGKTKRMEPDVVCKDIADKGKFSRCIAQLRQKIAEGCQDPVGSHPVLKSQQQRWIHVKLQAVVDNGELATTTLAIREDKCCGVGFLNQSGVWYELCDNDKGKTLPAAYNSVPLGAYYKNIGGVNYWDQVVGKLESKGLDFVTSSVRILSRYPDVKEDEDVRLALAGIILMVCESAKMNSLRDYFLGTWDKERSTRTVSFSNQELKNHIQDWEERSRALLYWRDHDYNNDKWGQHMTESDVQIPGSPQDALDIIYLVFNYCPRQVDMEYTIDNDATKFTEFIEDLQSRLAHHEHREDVDSGRRRRPVLGRFRDEEPARWFHIKLQLPDGKTTTLAVRDDTVHIGGFMNQSGKWYDLGYDTDPSSEGTILPPEYKSEVLHWGIDYEEILQVSSQKPLVLEPAVLGKDFATKAVRTLSRYGRPDLDVQEGDDLDPRVALAGLALMVSRSARFDTVCQHFERGWNTKTLLPPLVRRLLDFKDGGWLHISRALLRWRKTNYTKWDLQGRFEKDGQIKSGDDALDVVGLVFSAKPA